jgi:hypothetical protein
MEAAPANQPLRFDKGTLLLESQPPPGIASYFKWDQRAGAWRCDALHYPEVEGALKETCPDCSVRIPHGIKVRWPCANLPPLRADQESALQAWIKTGRGVLTSYQRLGASTTERERRVTALAGKGRLVQFVKQLTQAALK